MLCTLLLAAKPVTLAFVHVLSIELNTVHELLNPEAVSVNLRMTAANLAI
jgi:hypothetical protein